ncbi:MAG: hypothetical protein N4A35_09105 [Flavobacteriales bacterium]|jgi:hypothetical protein|nr:hypothetical protein [Flavobacteriales bacterium]
MHPVKNIYFIVFSVVYLFVQLFRKLEVQLPELLNSYGTDLLFMPLLLSFALWMTRLIKRDHALTLTLPMLLVTFLFVSFIFEYYLPARSSIYTADKIDVVMYFLGGIIFYYLQNRIFGSKVV